ncbi:hypothetical protein [Leeuwenhoekiella nanhaiensis]|uniref:Uncharacterized protein n=1 Tax=Leeuwenhoekiella nanhaiensis TaxID=1655491 RepID=A0A2G1VMD1_9FLAO|nr:hypothetical protein [Leeuwenhoekiella nanhaiensis]PHQ27884.1 hypothetical protein CJ305_17925 [Leeuwenhoekiella nanhaiensis]
MKKLLTTVMIIAFSYSYGQMTEVKEAEAETIGKIAPMGKLHIAIEKMDDEYKITFADAKYQYLDQYRSFKISETDYDDLYNRIISGYNEIPETPVKLMLEEGGYLFLEFEKSFGVKNFRFNHSIDDNDETLAFSIWMTEKKLNRLFDKK